MQLLIVAIDRQGEHIMNLKHVLTVLATLAIGYYIGTKYPGFWKGLVTT